MIIDGYVLNYREALRNLWRSHYVLRSEAAGIPLGGAIDLFSRVSADLFHLLVLLPAGKPVGIRVDSLADVEHSVYVRPRCDLDPLVWVRAAPAEAHPWRKLTWRSLGNNMRVKFVDYFDWDQSSMELEFVRGLIVHAEDREIMQRHVLLPALSTSAEWTDVQ